MSAPAVPPDATLRAFLLGALPPESAEDVRRWLDADPAHADRLARFADTDPLTDAVADRTPDPPAPTETVERLVRVASESRGALETPRQADTDGGTVPQFVAPAVPRPAEWPPTRLGQFRVVRELGHGGMGYVFEAADEALERRVAVKVLTPELARSPEAVARFLREARSAAKVEHENVVPVLHVGQDGAAPYMVMPLLTGESLADRLKRGPLPVDEAVRVGRDVAAGLAAAHDRGLVHRDLKPANVWLDAGTGRARVLDFGLAKPGDGSDALTQSGGLAGTPAYMSPELLDNHPATVRSDLFALGAVLYECLTGTRAFSGGTITAILKAISDHTPPAPDAVNAAVPPHLSALVMRLLAKNPADRPASAAEVLAALTSPPPPEPTPAEAAPTATLPPRSAEPKPVAPRVPRQFQIGCVITISLCLLVGVGIAVIPRRGREVARNETPAAPGRNWGGGGGAAPPPRALPPDRQPSPLVTGVTYRGSVDVLLARTKDDTLQRLRVAGALPMRAGDSFRIEAEVNPPAYLYLVWVDPERDVTPVFPWDAKKGWGSRPEKEEPRGKLSLPPDVGKSYRAPMAKPGVATMVLFACEKPLDAPDDVVRKWFEELPALPLPADRPDGAVWYENYREDKDPLRSRTFEEVESGGFAGWQGQLKSSLDGRGVVFQASVSFSRIGNK